MLLQRFPGVHFQLLTRISETVLSPWVTLRVGLSHLRSLAGTSPNPHPTPHTLSPKPLAPRPLVSRFPCFSLSPSLPESSPNGLLFPTRKHPLDQKWYLLTRRGPPRDRRTPAVTRPPVLPTGLCTKQPVLPDRPQSPASGWTRLAPSSHPPREITAACSVRHLVLATQRQTGHLLSANKRWLNKYTNYENLCPQRVLSLTRTHSHLQIRTACLINPLA